MKTIIISLSVVLACLTLPAQESPRPQVPIEQRFKQWDMNGDGKLTAEEVRTFGGAAGTKFEVDSKNDCFSVFMVQTQRCRSPAHNDFKRLATDALSQE